MILKFNVSTKKGDKQLTTWDVKQNAVYNSINRLYWNSRETIKEEYSVTLLVNGSEENTFQNQAGISSYFYNGKGERIEFKNPSIVFRGHEMGEITLNCRMHYQGKLSLYPDNAGRFTRSELTFFEASVYPTIMEFIASNKRALYEDARNRSIEYMHKALEEYKEAALRLEEEMNEIIKTFLI